MQVHTCPGMVVSLAAGVHSVPGRLCHLSKPVSAAVMQLHAELAGPDNVLSAHQCLGQRLRSQAQVAC